MPVFEFVSKLRKSKPYSFGFVRFTREKDARGAILRNQKISISISKYNNITQKPLLQKKEHEKRQVIKKVWKPAIRDRRSYKDAVKNKGIQGIPCLTLKSWLKGALICYNDEPMSVKLMEKVFEKETLKNIQGSKLDDFTFVVSKVVDNLNVHLAEEELMVLQSHFKHVIPLSLNYKVRFLRRFELLGIPLNCWTDDVL